MSADVVFERLPADGRRVISCTLPGAPFPYERPGLVVRNGRAQMFTPKGTRDAMKLLREQLVAFGVRRRPIESALPVRVWLTFRVRPSGRSGDVDNLVKTVLDACTGFVWKDDAQVIELHATRVPHRSPATVLEVTRVLPHEIPDYGEDPPELRSHLTGRGTA